MHPSDLAEREILHQKSLPCVSTPADFILVFRTLPNRLACIILLNCYKSGYSDFTFTIHKIIKNPQM